MLESSLKSLEEFTFASWTRKSSRQRSKLIVSVFSTISWFHELRLHLGATSVAEVAREVEPLLRATSERRKTVERRWREYRAGRHAPNEGVRAAAAKVCPSSRQVFESALWDALRLDRCARQLATALIGRTNKAGDELLSRVLALSAGRAGARPDWIRNRCRAVIKHGTLDSLATIIVCMRVAADAKATWIAEILAYWCGWCLYVLSAWLFDHGIIYGLAEYYQSYVLPECICGPSWVGFNAAHYLDSAAHLAARIEEKAASLGRDLRIDEIADYMLAIEAT